MPFDAAAQPTKTIRPTEGNRPGERMLHGAVEVFNSDLLNAHLAMLAVQDAPRDLTTLTYAELETLVSAWLRVSRGPWRDDFTLFGTRVCAERASRAEYIAVYGKRVAA